MKKITVLLSLAFIPLQLLYAVSFDTNNAAQVLIFPYYTVNKGFQSTLTISNNKDDYKILKIRFHDSKFGVDILSFSAFLTPHSTISFNISKDGDSATVSNTSSLCTSPSFPASPVSVRTGAYAGLTSADGTEGYIEVIEMGLIYDSDIINNLLQNNCSIIDTAISDGSFTQGGSESLDDTAGYYYYDDYPNGVFAPSGGLQGSIELNNVIDGESYTIQAIGIADYSYEAQHYITWDEDYYLLPSLATASNVNFPYKTDYGYSNSDVTPRAAVPSGISPYPMAHLLAKTELQTKLYIDPDLDIATDWIITNPMRVHNIFKNAGNRVTNTLIDNHGVASNIDLSSLNRAVNVFSYVSNGINTVFDSPFASLIKVNSDFFSGSVNFKIDYNFFENYQGAPLIATAITRNKNLLIPLGNKPQISAKGGFIKLDVTGGGAPKNNHCSGPSNYFGRMVADEVNGTLYICMSSGWKAFNSTASNTSSGSLSAQEKPQISVKNGFFKLATTGGNIPIEMDCSSRQNHYGRLLIDEINETFYVCTAGGGLRHRWIEY